MLKTIPPQRRNILKLFFKLKKKKKKKKKLENKRLLSFEEFRVHVAEGFAWFHKEV